MTIQRFIIVAIVISILSSCVSPRKVEDERNRRIKCEEENALYASKNKALTEANNELNQKNNDLISSNQQLARDTSIMGKSYRRLVKQYDKVNDLNDELIAKMKEKNALTDAETTKLLSELQTLQEDLQRREDALKTAQIKLSEDQNRLAKLSNELKENQSLLDKNQSLLDEKVQRVAELENMIAAKDSALTSFKENLSNALLGFEGDGLTIEQRNGKVYVSLEEKVLFKSGKWTVDPKGQTALKKLASVLVDNPDINIMIEGHTDNVPYKGSTGIKDNWDLSVKRSTSIVKILLKNKDLDARRIIAAGRGEFLPVDLSNTKEGRAKNRRTEIILTPNWDEIFKVLEK